MLFIWNDDICSASQPLQAAYLRAYQAWGQPLLLRAGGGAGWCGWEASTSAGASGSAGTAGGCPEPTALALCKAMQPASQLIVGYLLPCYAALWRRELRARQSFLAARGLRPTFGWPCALHYLGHALVAALLLYTVAVAA